MELRFVFYETTGSGDFKERSTSWLIFNQYGYEGAIPIGIADPEWTLIGTNNVTLWSWKLEKTLNLQYNMSESSLFYPYEAFEVGFYLVSDTDRYFTVSTVPYYEAAPPNRTEVNEDQLPSNFQFGDLSENLKIDLSISPDGVANFIAIMIYIVYGILLLLLLLLYKKRKRITFSDSSHIASSIFMFLPILIFTFRTSIAPIYLTPVDSIGFLLIVFFMVCFYAVICF